jgi:Glycosyltransferase 61
VYVDFEQLECVSAFDIVSAKSIRIPFSTDALGAGIQLVELLDVLYLPSILELGQSICVVERQIIPKESILDCSSVAFLKSRRNNPTYGKKYAADFHTESFEAPACILGNLFARNFGHWTEELLKVVILEESKQDCYYVLADMPPFARDFLVFLGIDQSRILSINRPTVFKRAIFTTAISHDNISEYPDTLFRFRDLIQRQLGNRPPRFGPRVWLEREEKLNNGGFTANKEEVYRCIQKYDFDIVDMATLPVADQLRTATAATMIAGPHGAQFVHAQFMPVASTVIECFSPIHVNPSILQICRVLKHSYHQIVARTHLTSSYAHGRDCVVDCEHLALVLDSLK